MWDFKQWKIKNKLLILSLISISSIVILGFVANYFFRTSKVLGIIINAERVHNNTFQAGIEDFYKYQISKEARWLDSSVVKLESANRMANHFSIIDQLLQLQEKEAVDLLFNTYEEAYNHDQSNTYLMADRVRLLLVLKNDKLKKAQKVALGGYQLGEKIKQEILAHKNDPAYTSHSLQEDLGKMRIFYHDFAVNISAINDFANQLLFLGITLLVILLVSGVGMISKLIISSIADPVNEMVEKFQVIATGNLNTEISISSHNEIGDLARSFQDIQNGLREVIAYTKKVAEGDYSAYISPRSSEDEMSIALNKMVEQLRQSHERTEMDSWFKSGFNQLNKALSGDQHVSDLANNALSFMMNFLHSQLGSIYLYNEEYRYLKLTCTVGFDTKKLKERIKLNEGLTGRAGAEKKILFLSEIDEDKYTTYASSGEFHPKQVVLIPLMNNDNLVGVMELSSLYAYTEIEKQFIKESSGIIAINLISAINMVKTSELLQKTQDQASELQVQQEELRVANEELMEHTKVLTESEKRLQVQQEELRVANEELEERTRQLEIQKEAISLKNTELTDTRDKLELKAKELQLSSQYKSEFLANMSHELRTPLNSLLILSNLLSSNKTGNLTPDQVRSAKIIHKSGSDLLHLINEVLDLSKIEAGKMTIEIADVKAEDIREEILMNFTAAAEDKKLNFNVRVAADFPAVIETDRYRLMQIIRNLLSNAIKFTSTGSVKVDFLSITPNHIFSNANLKISNACCIKVTDTGVGIPGEKMEAIFEAFQQADGSISRKYGGTGLGLSISKELVRMLGGEIQLESKINEGSSFSLFIPIRQTKAAEGQIMDIGEAEPITEKEMISVNTYEASLQVPLPFLIDNNTNPPKGEPTVLIIHPLMEQAERFCQQARAKNYEAMAAASIKEGLTMAEEIQPIAIMLAHELVTNKGWKHYEQLKAHPLTSKLPVHVISPIEYMGSGEESTLKTLETFEFTDALNKLELNPISHSKRILVVEDDRVTRQLVKELFKYLDIEIKEANLAEEAYEIMSSEAFDCIILDLGLPDYSGMELLEKLKSADIRIPKVIIYTGKEISKEVFKSLNSYTDTIILKGLKSDERLMDEVTLFLHQVSKINPAVKAKPHTTESNLLFKGKKILVVDDDIRNVFALGKVLEEREIEVLEAENGQMAIDILQEHQNIDLVLMDVMMPVMNGYEAMQIIRNTPEIKDIPIICLTAKAMKEDHENALKNGANDYLSKPLNEEKLFAMLKIWLYKK